jgi:hypothetical protein
MIQIYDAPEYLLEGQRWLEDVRARHLHLVCPALTGQPDSHAYRSLEGAISPAMIEDCCTRVNNAVDIGSTWPKRYVSLLPVPPHSDKANWYRIFLDMFKVHYMKDQSYTILVLLDASVYPDTAFIRKELERAGRDYDAPMDRKVPFTYFHAED